MSRPDETTRGVIEGLGSSDDNTDPIAKAEALRQVRAGLGLRTPEPITIGHYVLLRRLGAGGIGLVYAAYDSELDRKVAIKLLRGDVPEAGRTTTPGQSWLLREARALARLAHPNVVAVYGVEAYDLGATGPRLGGLDRGVYIVMEHVDGVDVGAWLRERARTWREILDVFLAAGRGLAAAHAQGIVHRDFKPSNVLVGDDGRVRVLDFGIARASAQDADRPAASATPSLVASTGEATPTAMVMGTPSYMAPEQHRLGAVDARTDVYAFCVTLYEALCGVRPFQPGDVDELLARKLDKRVTAPARAHGAPAMVLRIVMRGLEPDPLARPSSIEEVIAVLERALARRRKGLLVAGATAALSTGVMLTRAFGDEAHADCDHAGDEIAETWNDGARSTARTAFAQAGPGYAEDTWARIELVLSGWTERWASARTETCRAASGESDGSVSGVGEQIVCLDRARAHFGGVVRLLGEADADVIVRAASIVAELPEPDDCRQLDRGGPIAQVANLDALADARAAADAAKYDDAQALAQRLRDDAVAAGDPGTAARATMVLSRVARFHDDPGLAEELFLSALYDAERAADDRLVTEILVELVLLTGDLRGEYDDAERFAALAEARMGRGGVPAKLPLRLRYHVARMRIQQARFTEAEASLRSVMTELELAENPDDVLIADVSNALGVSLGHQARFEEARMAYLASQERRIAVLGPTHPSVGVALGNAAIMLLRLGRIDEAEAELREAVALLDQASGPMSQDLAINLINLGVIHYTTGRHEDALREQTRALEMLTTKLGRDHVRLAEPMTALARTLLALGRAPEALESARGAVAILERYPEHQARPTALSNLSVALAATGRLQESIAVGDRAATEFVAQHGEVAELAYILADLAEGERALGDRERARARAKRALALPGIDEDTRARLQETLTAVELDG